MKYLIFFDEYFFKHYLLIEEIHFKAIQKGFNKYFPFWCNGEDECNDYGSKTGDMVRVSSGRPYNSHI